MKNLQIEWRHLDVNGETCERCGDTGNALRETVFGLEKELSAQGFEIHIVETVLMAEEIAQSNLILFDGKPIEELIDLKTERNYCASCSDLIGQETECRSVIFHGERYEDIPAEAIREAVLAALGLEDSVKKIAEKSGCRCGENCC